MIRYPAKPLSGGAPLNGLHCRLASSPDWMQEAKLDGVRAYWDGVELWSRTGLRLPRCDDIRAALPRGIAFDGEVVGGTYWVFDLPTCTGIYTERRAALVCTLALVRGARVRLTPHVTWEDVERLGLEGVVFKRKKSRYPPLAHRPGVQTPAWVKFRTTTATTTTTTGD